MSTAMKHRMLRAFSMQPTNLRAFTDGDVTMALPVRHIEKYAAELVADGLVLQAGDLFYITDAGVAEVNRPPETAQPRIWCAASSKDEYVPARMNPVRAGADDHKQYRSLSTWRAV